MEKYTCPLCESKFDFDKNGKHIAKYNLTVCRTCFNANHDGWSPIYTKKILAHLEANNIEAPVINEKGCIPRGD